jgi:hypothetical protein
MLYLINGSVLKRSTLNVWGRRLGDAAGERRPPKAARTKHVPQTLNSARFRGRGWRCINKTFHVYVASRRLRITASQPHRTTSKVWRDIGHILKVCKATTQGGKQRVSDTWLWSRRHMIINHVQWLSCLVLAPSCNLDITRKHDVNGLFLVLSLVIRYHKFVVREIVLRDHLLTKRRQTLFSILSLLHLSIYPM